MMKTTVTNPAPLGARFPSTSTLHGNTRAQPEGRPSSPVGKFILVIDNLSLIHI